MDKILLQLGELTWSKVFILGLVMLGIYWFLYYDDGANIQSSVSTLQSRATAAEKSLAETKQAISDVARFEKELSNNEKQFDKVKEHLPVKLTLNDLVRTISDLANATSVKVVSITPKEEQERKDFYEILRVEFKLSGQFNQLVKFLSLVSKQTVLVTFAKVGIETAFESGSRPLSGNVTTGTDVIMTGNALAYRYIDDPSEEASAGGSSASSP